MTMISPLRFADSQIPALHIHSQAVHCSRTGEHDQMRGTIQTRLELSLQTGTGREVGKIPKYRFLPETAAVRIAQPM
jgi:hypothetical protein